MARDTQRQKVYDAEAAAFPGSRRGDSLTVSDMQALVEKWCSSKVLQRRYPRAKRPPTVTDGRSRRSACYDPWSRQLRIPRWSRNKPVLLHELAHALTYAGSFRAWHGWEFCECYLYLVRVFMGKSAEEALKQQFKARRVRFREPRRRQMTEGQRQAARERMLALHARKAEKAAA